MINENNDTNISIDYLNGLGPKRVEALKQEGIFNILDLILYFPINYINRETAGSITEVRDLLLKQTYSHLAFQQNNVSDNSTNENSQHLDFNLFQEVSIVGTVMMQQMMEMKKNRKKFLILTVRDNQSNGFEIVFFRLAEFFKSKYPVGTTIIVSGNPTLNQVNRRIVTFTHPDIEVIESEDIDFYSRGGIIPKYRIPENMRKVGITIRLLRNVINNVLDKYFINNNIMQIPESIPEYIINNYKLLSISQTIFALHKPEGINQINSAKYRIKFEELFWYEIQLNIQRAKYINDEKSICITEKSKLARELYDTLPFALTSDQKRVLREFAQDFASNKPMNRLLQGDVGSGKTIVAILAMLMVIDAGYQVLLMAPTELLAEQHYYTISNLLKDKNEDSHNANNDNIFEEIKDDECGKINKFSEVKIEILLGSTKKTDRKKILDKIGNGKTNIIIGTHTLFQNEMKYNNLGLVIIDEQHRFGVSQRAEIINLAKQSMNALCPHALFMTATPIPRTLTMTAYGDLDISIIKTMPKDRKPIITRIAFESERKQVFNFALNEIKKGRQIYCVYPLVEKSEKMELKSAIEHFEIVANEIFPEYKCGLLHGQMKWQEKEEIMAAFKNNEFQILVATTVVEVGIDVPNASVMIIEDSERYGLSQLHQLRGRVGRGIEQSYCILLTKDDFRFKFANNRIANPDDEKIKAITRLKAMENSNDGFKLSEIDLKLRGPGDMLGTKQSGLPDFKYVDLINDIEIIQTTSMLAKNISNEDPNLILPQNKIIKEVLSNINKSNGNFINIA
jgi:ATP-dependent DNA helicase RecG